LTKAPLHAGPVSNVLTLIGGANTSEAMPSFVDQSRVALHTLGARVLATDWLCPGQACDILFEGIDVTAAKEAVRASLALAQVDIAVQPLAGRRKRLLVADMESTIITRELIDELARLAGLGSRIAEITGRSMRGEVDFAQSLRERVAMLAGAPADLLTRVKELIELMPGARKLVQTMKAAGARTVLVSGGFDHFAAIAAERCGFDEYRANHLEVAQGRIVGKVAEPILDRAGKRATLERIAKEHSLTLKACAAVGDGANDIDMLQSAGLGVAFHAKPAVAAAARFRLDHADLTGLLYLQGVRSEDIKE
jgi:phosphoserine phosphatase